MSYDLMIFYFIFVFFIYIVCSFHLKSGSNASNLFPQHIVIKINARFILKIYIFLKLENATNKIYKILFDMSDHTEKKQFSQERRLIGIILSTTSVSLPNRFNRRPAGVLSKNDIGLRSTCINNC